MDKYTCKNLIIDPETQGLEDIIGKEVYYNDTPIRCIDKANESYPVGILKEIHKHSYYPFCVETPTAGMVNFACIIPKREEPKPEYVSFESKEEFINAYDDANYSVRSGTVENKMLNYGGIWLRYRNVDVMCMVTEIWKEGVVLGNDQEATSWNELLENYVFFDGSPCGRLKGNK